MNRRLSGWVEGLIQEAVVSVSRRRGASVDCVNARYTLQVVRCHPSFGRPDGGRLHCTVCGAVYDVDVVAAENILERRADPDTNSRARSSPPAATCAGQDRRPRRRRVSDRLRNVLLGERARGLIAKLR